jgi:hypothetical protein
MGVKGPAVTAVQLALRNAGYDLKADGASEPSRYAQALDKIAPPRSVLKVAPWLSTMRAITGTKEAPSSKDNPFIIERDRAALSRSEGERRLVQS